MRSVMVYPFCPQFSIFFPTHFLFLSPLCNQLFPALSSNLKGKHLMTICSLKSGDQGQDHYLITADFLACASLASLLPPLVACPCHLPPSRICPATLPPSIWKCRSFGENLLGFLSGQIILRGCSASLVYLYSHSDSMKLTKSEYGCFPQSTSCKPIFLSL